MKTTLVAFLLIMTSTSSFALDFFQCHTDLKGAPARIVRVNIGELKLITDYYGHKSPTREVIGVMGMVGAKSAQGKGEANDDIINLILQKNGLVVGEIYATKTNRPGILEGVMRMEGIARSSYLEIDCVHHTLSK